MDQASSQEAVARPALLCRIADTAVQAYIQHYPFCSGPDAARNAACRRLIAASLELRSPAPPAVERIALAGLPDGWIGVDRRARFAAALAAAGVPADRHEYFLRDLGWKVLHAPAESRRILAMGCGGGAELVFLRAMFPEAEISAVDFDDSVPAGWKTTLGVSFEKRHILDYLADRAGAFDLVFSNHVVEHFYDPEDALARIRAALRPGGAMVAAMPLDGDAATPYYAAMTAMARRAAESPASEDGAGGLTLEYGVLSAGHPWKTNEADLAATLQGAGFGNIAILRKTDYPSRQYTRSRPALERHVRFGFALDGLLLRPLRGLIRLAFPRRIPERAGFLYYALERRCWFGRTNLVNLISPEVLVRATVA